MEPIYAQIVPPCNYIRTSDFSLKDLHLFVDSMEDLSRIERERSQRRQRRKESKFLITKSIVEVHSPPPLTNIIEYSSEEELPKVIQPKKVRTKLFTPETKISPVVSSDENYFSGASESSEGNTNKVSIKNDDVVPLPSNDSGTESESGVFKLRPRSFAMTNPKYRTTRARIIGLVLKREYANGGGSQEELEKRCERVLESLTKEKRKCSSLRLPYQKEARTPIICKSAKQPSPEIRFIDKALRYLTL